MLKLVLTITALLAMALTLVVMWTITDFAHSAEDVAVLFYAALAVAPYGFPLQQAAFGFSSPAHLGVYLFGSLVISGTGLYAYYHAFFLVPNDHSGFMFLFVPLIQAAAYYSLHWFLRNP